MSQTLIFDVMYWLHQEFLPPGITIIVIVNCYLRNVIDLHLSDDKLRTIIPSCLFHVWGAAILNLVKLTTHHQGHMG